MKTYKLTALVILVLTALFTACCGLDTSSPRACQTMQQDAPMDPDEDVETNPMVGFKIVQFTAVWCGPCKKQSPIIDRMATEGYPVLRCDVDQNKPFATKCKVTQIPTIIFFLDGKVLERYIGVQSYEAITKRCNELRPPPKPDVPKPTPIKPTDDDDSGLPIDKQRFPYKFQ